MSDPFDVYNMSDEDLLFAFFSLLRGVDPDDAKAIRDAAAEEE